MKFFLRSTLLYLCLFLPSASAQESEFDFNVGVSSFSSTGHELVYDPQSMVKLSELTWVIESAPLIKFDLNYREKDSAISLYYKINATQTQGVMDDYDWLKTGITAWSHWSHHENTTVEEIKLYGIVLESHLFDEYFRFSAGYEVERKKWKAYDGSYIYSSNTGFRDLTGTFSGLGITYVQQYETFFLALSAERSIDDVLIKGRLFYAPSARAFDEDTHHFRNIQFDSSFKEITMKGFSGSIEYNYDDEFYFLGTYTYKEYDEKKGYTTYTDLSTGDSITYRGAGISNVTSFFEFSLGRRF